jgi:hypothetical protein
LQLACHYFLKYAKCLISHETGYNLLILKIIQRFFSKNTALSAI